MRDCGASIGFSEEYFLYFVQIYRRHVTISKQRVMGVYRRKPHSFRVQLALMAHHRGGLMSVNYAYSLTYQDISE